MPNRATRPVPTSTPPTQPDVQAHAHLLLSEHHTFMLHRTADHCAVLDLARALGRQAALACWQPTNAAGQSSDADA